MLKPVILPDKIIDNQDMSSTFYSEVVNIQYMDNIGVQLEWTGDAVGEFFVELSNDKITWNVLPIYPYATVLGVPGSHYLDLNQLSPVYIRIRYEWSALGGICNGYITAKII